MTDDRERLDEMVEALMPKGDAEDFDFYDEKLRALEAVALDLLRQLRERDKTEYAWLLERRKDGRSEWLGLDATGDWFWSTDSLKALRFARKQDGEAMCAIIEDAEMVTEHGWGP